MGRGRGLAFLVALAAAVLSAGPAAAAPPRTDDSSTASPTSPPAPASKTDASSGPHYRLPVTAVPVGYAIDLTMGPTDSDTFSGKVVITAVAVRSAPFLTLHMDLEHLKLKADSPPTVYKKGKNEVLPLQTRDDAQLQTLTLQFESGTLVPGDTYEVTIAYTGTLRKDMYGFYRSNFTAAKADGTLTETKLAATQFEPTHARSAFPCWDEPHYKAVFSLSITHAANQYALANTAGQTRPDGATMKTTFNPTPPMSTYLVAFVVSDMEFESPNITTTSPETTPATSPMPYSVLVRPGQTGQATYAAEVGPLSLGQLSEYTGIPFSSMGLGKLDLIAIPDFSAGAMENWGLITFRETGLMFQDDESTESAKESIALVIAHEQAHMWFGDLVSPEWWGYVWLNEGFARYMQFVAMNMVKPEWQLMDKFVVQTLQAALSYDALASSHPMSATVHTPSEISSIFDRISYDKGASVLHMTRKVLGEENFQSAIRSYLTEMKYFAASPQDLFRAFDGVKSTADFKLPDGVTMATVLKTWTEEAGYPVVTLHKEANGTITVTQSRFSSTESESSKADDTRWWVPLTYVLEGGNFDSPDTKWLDPSDASTSIASADKKWVVANIRQMGFYRVNYDEDNWAAVGALLQAEGGAGVDAVPSLSRAALLDDALSLARAGALRYAAALDLTRYLRAEKEAMPWTAVLPHLAFLHKALAGGRAQDAFKAHILHLLESVYDDVGFDEVETDSDANHQRLIFRATLLGHACRLGHDGCVGNATAAFKDFLSGVKRVAPSQRSTVYCTGLRNGDNAAWQKMWDRYGAASTTPGEKSLILAALGCSRDNATLKAFLGYSLDGGKVRPQDAQTVFGAVLNGNDDNLAVAFQFFKDNLADMRKQYGSSSMQKVVEGLAGKMFDESMVQELEEALHTNGDALGMTPAAAARSLETARANLAWRAHHLDSVSAWTRGEASGAPAALAAGPLALGLALAVLLLPTHVLRSS